MSGKTIRVMAVLLTLGMVFSLTACNKKQVTAEKFMSVIEENGFSGEIVPDLQGSSDGSNLVEGAFGTGTEENPIYTAIFYRFSGKDAALKGYDDVVETFKLDIESRGFKGTEYGSDKGNMKRIAINASKTNDESTPGIYSVIVQVDDVVIHLIAVESNAESIEKIDSILKDLGYYYP